MYSFPTTAFISYKYYSLTMFEYLNMVMYPVIGFVPTFLVLETIWHFKVCKSRGSDAQPCVFKEVKMLVASSRRL